MRRKLDRAGMRALMKELARTAPSRRSFRVYFVGGGTAVLSGWRDATIDADLCASDDGVFRDIQGLKERLGVNVEFARPEDFVPPLAGSEGRHVFIESIGPVSFFHYDPYAQLLSKVVRGFDRDMRDAASFVKSGMTDPATFRRLVAGIPGKAYARYPSLSRTAVLEAVDRFLSDLAD